MLFSGVVDGLSYAWKSGMTQWKQIADVQELKQLLIEEEEEEETEVDNTEEEKKNIEKSDESTDHRNHTRV